MKESLSLTLALVLAAIALSDAYKIGLGRADATGPSVEITFVSQRDR